MILLIFAIGVADRPGGRSFLIEGFPDIEVVAEMGNDRLGGFIAHRAVSGSQNLADLGIDDPHLLAVGSADDRTFG